ncbi:MAG: efflux RND transporter periplasmic adaptor subunit [Candidatus Magasanikbacteria bacterium]
MNAFIKKITEHKLVVGIVVVVLVGAGYFIFQKLNPPASVVKYSLSTVQKGTLINSVSGTGQISASNQVDLKPKASGDVLSVNVVEGQAVKTGNVLAYLNARDALKSVRDAQSNLESAKLSYAKFIQPADEITMLQAENAITTALDAKQKAIDNLNKAYEDGFNAISNAFLSIPTVISDLYDNMYGYKIGYSNEVLSSGQPNASVMINLTYSANTSDINKLIAYKDGATSDYNTARSKYDTNFTNYKNVTRYSDPKIIETLLNETVETVKSMSQSAKSENNFYDAWVDYRTINSQPVYTQVTTYQKSISTDIGTINGHLSTLLSIQRTIQDSKDSITSNERTIVEKNISLKNLQAGADVLDIKTQELSLKQKENALLDAQEKLSDYSIRAPFDSVVADIALKKGDSASSGATAFTLMSAQGASVISLNEVDVSKIKVGQKATLTFDAIENLSLSGTVAEIDILGTVAQGVVTYNVKIVFDTQDPRAKPGMSVSAAIITDVKQDVLMVPSSAVKTNGNESYVEIIDTADIIPSATTNGPVTAKNAPHQQVVEVGASNDTSIEIISGLNEGDTVVSQTISSATKTTTSASGSGMRIPGLTGGGGGGNMGR